MLKWHQEHGDDIVFVTASLEPYVRPMSKTMGVETVFCSAMEHDGDTYSGDLVGGNCRGDEKARRLTQWLQGRSLDYAYGDSAGDDAMLAMALTPIRVGRRDVSPSQLMQ
jgi:phosphatidylglycerophosphatase C